MESSEFHPSSGINAEWPLRPGNGAVETCFGSFHRYAQYMNFSHPLIKAKFNPNACGWAYGMNFFDLDSWRREKCTEQYHYWQNQNENRTL
ncbi:glycosyltransferase, partial [Klebsiella pneumoniae]|uniref:glycosyltransferase n=1 Tax=Klebsiella pneumoniae TaxID=573 RepID=UPI003C6D7936